MLRIAAPAALAAALVFAASASAAGPGDIVTVVGNGASATTGDGGSPTAASIEEPSAVAVTAAGAILFTDRAASVVRQVDNGVITTIAGTADTAGFSGDGGAATAATLSGPDGLAVGPGNAVLVADTATTGSAASIPTGRSPPSPAAA